MGIFSLILGLFLSCFLNLAQAQEEAADPAEVALGERLFNDFRFSEFFYTASQGNVNHVLEEGDPQLEYLRILENKATQPSPFRGQASSCLSCHMVEQARDLSGLPMRSYADYASTSPIPIRDSQLDPSTLRNSQSVILITPNQAPIPEFFHWDGEFNSLEELVVAGLTGRNIGWLVEEREQALQNIANVIRGDDGLGELAKDFGGYTYKEWFLSEDPLLPDEVRLPSFYRLDVESASTTEIVNRVALLISAYIRNLSLQKDDNGHYSGSPYDVFLRKNRLDPAPRMGESDRLYAERLLAEISSLENPAFVTAADGSFATHDQTFQFGPEELEGLKFFLTIPEPGQHRMAGACAQCHTPPHFTDFGFHNIGLSQFQYERVHGADTFKNLKIPGLAERNQNSHLYGLPTPDQPKRQRLLSSAPSSLNPQLADLGLWSLFANPDFAHLQSDLKQSLAISLPEANTGQLSNEDLLPLTIGMMKTPSLRNLGHSDPYFRNGHAPTIEAAVAMYVMFSRGARHGAIQPVDPKILNIHMHGQNVDRLAKFLKSLNEDYD